MGLTIIAQATEVVPLQLQVTPRTPTLYPRARVYAETGSAPIATVDLTLVENGLYRGSYGVPSADKFLISYQIFSDAGRTTDVTDNYDVDTDLIVADATNVTPPVVASFLDPAGAP